MGVVWAQNANPETPEPEVCFIFDLSLFCDFFKQWCLQDYT